MDEQQARARVEQLRAEIRKNDDLYYNQDAPELEDFEYDRLTQERQVDEIWGADEVESGVLLRFQVNQFGVSGDQRVTGVTHRYGSTHLMSLTVQNPAQGRAAGSGDTVEV